MALFIEIAFRLVGLDWREDWGNSGTNPLKYNLLIDLLDWECQIYAFEFNFRSERLRQRISGLIVDDLPVVAIVFAK